MHCQCFAVRPVAPLTLGFEKNRMRFQNLQNGRHV